MSADDDERWMREALAVATSRGRDSASTAIGCVIVRDGRIIGSAHNERQTFHDGTAHAQVATDVVTASNPA